ncbi:MAG TPA: sigma-70 family RNA polymerase sigma factor [Rubricoccaceae bacterium]|jgi:RNA polymerase sigma-70 factor (ECF subfamily)
MTTTDRLDDHVRRERAGLLAFVRSKLDDPDLAEDVLQDSLLRAVRGAPELRDDEKMTSWLYQVVRNAVTDTYRRRATSARHHDTYEADVRAAAEMTPEDEARACACLLTLVPALKPEYAAVVEADLSGADEGDLADRLGITKNNLKVRRHRAHRQLRERVEQTCRSCAAHGCVDCSCRQPPQPTPPNP